MVITASKDSSSLLPNSLLPKPWDSLQQAPMKTKRYCDHVTWQSIVRRSRSGQRFNHVLLMSFFILVNCILLPMYWSLDVDYIYMFCYHLDTHLVLSSYVHYMYAFCYHVILEWYDANLWFPPFASDCMAWLDSSHYQATCTCQWILPLTRSITLHWPGDKNQTYWVVMLAYCDAYWLSAVTLLGHFV